MKAPCCLSAGGFLQALPAPDKHVSAHPAVQLWLLHALTEGRWSPILANSMAILLSTQVNFVLSYLFTWHDRRPAEGTAHAVLGQWATYQGAVAGKVFAENISKVLYPNDEEIQGKELRLQQQYFFTSCALQDMIRLHLRVGRPIETFHEKWAIQLNDTHPSIGVAELMRLLVDEHDLVWEKAWEITSHTFSSTNHTLLPEALERWPLAMFASLLPRHIEIIYEINARFLDLVRKHFDGDQERVSRMSIIDEQGEKHVRMANLACAGSHRVNGVAALHTELLKKDVLHDFHELLARKIH